MTSFPTRLICLSLMGSVTLMGCQQVQQFADKNPEIFSGGIGALVGGGVGAAVGGKNHRAGGILIGAAAGALVGGGIGYGIRKYKQNKASAAERERAQNDARLAREEMAKKDSVAAEKLQEKPVKQLVPVARNEEKKETTYVMVDPKTGLAGEDSYVVDDTESKNMLTALDNKKSTELEGQEVVFTPASSPLAGAN